MLIKKIRIYTSYYDNVKTLPDNIIPVAISGWIPESFKGLSYKKISTKILVWKKWEDGELITKEEMKEYKMYNMNYLIDKKLNNDDYVALYKETILKYTSIDALYEKFKDIFDSGKTIAFICYEKPGLFCHRHEAGKWAENKGIKCIEYCV